MNDRNASTAKDEAPPWAAGTEGRHHELYPDLTEDEIAVIASYGEKRVNEDGARLWEIGERGVDFHLVLDGELEILRRDLEGEAVLVSHERGSYSGEIVTMTGRGAFVAGRAKGRLISVALSPTRLRDLLALEAELGEKILLSLILRRMRMIAEHLGDVILVGDVAEKDTAKIREFLSRNGVPYDVVDPTATHDAVRREKLQLDGEEFPIVICGEKRLSRPSSKEVADHLGLSAEIDPGAEFDVAVIGGGPGGLAAAVYGASEGLSVVVLEKCAVGGQAGSSSRIENYLGFPTGISGQALTGRGFLQAQKFGAEVAIAREVRAMTCGDPFHTLELENGDKIKARTVVIASGAVYRQPDVERLEEFEGGGVHYGASHIQGVLCRGKHAAVVGGGNSAGQAAIYLARRARKVSILVRGDGLAHSMSDYLIRRIEKIENIDLITHTEVEGVTGDDSLEAVSVRNNRTGDISVLDAEHLFIFIGAKPANEFLDRQVCLDGKGFVKTGEALCDADLSGAGWTLDRKPYLSETSCPRVFAVGDIRSGSVKRVASAVGEGSVCVQFIHQTLEAQTPGAPTTPEAV